MASLPPTNSPSSDDPFARLARSLSGVDPAEAGSSSSGGAPLHVPEIPPWLRVLGDYELVARLGHGGQGKVFRARHRSIRGKFVAVKFLHEHARFDPTSIERFNFEAQAASRLNHPGIVSVVTLGEQNGVQYIVQELVEGGRTLEKELDARRKVPPKDHERWVAELFVKIADALEALHQQQVIHRDLKPVNILLTPKGEPKVADFGLARDLEAPRVTASDASLGTLAYMSPEQAAKQHDAIGPRTDVYALGVTLYEALTFTRLVPEVTDLEKHRIILLEPAPDLRSLRASIPPELSLICRMALEKEPARRYASMADFGTDLRRFLNDEPIRAKPPSALRRARLCVRRNPVISVSGGVGVLALAVISGLLVKQVRTAAALEKSNGDLRDQTRRAEQGEDGAKRNATAAQIARDEATQKANDVLSLSAQKDHDDLVAEAEKLWPAHPEMIPAYEDWLRRANGLIEGRPADEAKGLKKRPSLAEHKAKLAELRTHARPLSEEQIRADRESHPKFAELQAKQAELLWRWRMLGDEPWPSDAAVDDELTRQPLPTDADALNSLAWPLVDPAKPVYGQEVRALLLARRAVAAASEEKRSGIRDTLAWAVFKVGRFEEALSEHRTALSEPGGDALKSSAADLEKAVASWRGDELAKRRETRDKLGEEVGALTAQVDERRTYEFDDPEKGWWNRQLVKLVSDLEALRDPESGLMNDVLSEPFGWGVAKRYEFAKSIGERSISGSDPSRLWSEAIAAIKASSKYGGLEIVPQTGLLPIGMDPDSQLWEFAHLQTGEPAARGADGKLVLTEDTGLVFVLIPGGKFWMGAQTADPNGRNFDPQAHSIESPVHEVELSHYFLSKYEMTQGQWQRLLAVNPSNYGPSGYQAFWNREISNWCSLHPVEQVSWTSCLSLMERAGLALPREAQWEYGARSGTSSVYSSGEDWLALSGVANIADVFARSLEADTWGKWLEFVGFDDGHLCHCPVGSFRPNGYGLHDVHGNVKEWCMDWFEWDSYLQASANDPVSPSTSNSWERTLRGGSFACGASQVRSAHREGLEPGGMRNDLGLRPARTLHSAPSPLLAPR